MQKLSPSYYTSYIQGNLDYIVSEPGGSVWVEDTTNINRIFSGRLSYAKGAFLVRMLQWTLGDSIFFKAVRQYHEDARLRYNFATTQDLQRNLEQVSKKNLQYFFDQWFYGEGYPSFTVEWSQNFNSYLQLNITQTTSHSSVKFFKVPLQLILKNATKEKTIVIDYTENKQQVSIPVDFKVDTVLIDPQHFLISKNNKSVFLNASAITNDLKVYPNPFNDRLTISLRNPTANKLQVQLFNVLGQNLLIKNFNLNGQDETITVSDYASFSRGIYFLHISIDDHKPIIKKIVK
jgi:hypothetical protein